MKHRAVVSNFLFRVTTNDDVRQVALFRRSIHPNIRSYQDKYSPIAGSIEASDRDPIAAATREIFEETQLVVGRDIELEFCGSPFSFEDADAGRSWTVYPYGWLMRVDESNVKLDWEHSGWDWFDPKMVLNGSMDDQCVPRISDSLQRIYFGPNGMFHKAGKVMGRDSEAGKTFLDTITKLKFDTEHGARVLANEALRSFAEMLTSFEHTVDENHQPAEYWYALRLAAFHFIYSSRPSMNAPIRAAVVTALSSIRDSMENDGFVVEKAISILAAQITERGSALSRLARSFNDHVESLKRINKSPNHVKIITISYSSSVLAALQLICLKVLAVADQTVSITILESRPLCEGARLAADLAAYINTIALKSNHTTTKMQPKVKITVVPDTYSTMAFQDTVSADSSIPTIVLLGADRITPCGHVFNKTGSNPLARVASMRLGSELGSVVVLGETDKISVPPRDTIQSYSKLVDGLSRPEKNATSSAEMNTLLDRLSSAELQAQPYEQHEAKEVYSAWDEKTKEALVPYFDQQDKSAVQVEIQNNHVELIKAGLIDHYITESGEMTVEQIMAHSVRGFSFEEAVFADLYD